MVFGGQNPIRRWDSSQIENEEEEESWKEGVKGEAGMERAKNAKRCYLDIVEEGYQEEAHKRKVVKKERKTREVEKAESETKSFQK